MLPKEKGNQNEDEPEVTFTLYDLNKTSHYICFKIRKVIYRRPCLTASFACKGSQYRDDVHLSGERAASVIICTAFRDHRHAAVSTRRGEPRSKHKSLFPLSIRFHRYEGSNINTTPRG